MRKQRLTRNELVKNIKLSMPEDYNEYERLAYIEMEVAKQISFDEKYLWGDTETRKKIYELAKRQAQRPSRKVNKKLICVTMAELFGYVAKKFGFNVKYQNCGMKSENKTEDEKIFRNLSKECLDHICPIVELSDNTNIQIDIQADLARLQMGFRPKAFGNDRSMISMFRDDHTRLLDKDIVDSTFKKVYKLEKDEEFTDEYIRSYITRLKNEGKRPIEILEIFMEDPRIKKQLVNMKCTEANELYKVILRTCYNTTRGKQFYLRESQAMIGECMLVNDKNKKRYSFCIYAEEDGEKLLFVYSKKSRKIVKLTEEEIFQMRKQPLDIRISGFQSSIKDNMMEFIKNAKGNCVDTDEHKHNITIEEIFRDEDEYGER